jgi:thymidylate synthase (FAD)
MDTIIICSARMRLTGEDMPKEQSDETGATKEPNEKRDVAKGLDLTLGRPYPVLSGGFVRAIDYMGTDASIVEAARVSYGQGTRTVHEDRGLIRYLMRHHHTTPFEMCEIKLHVRVPMDTWRQWIRHRTANVNEYSTRYSIAIDEALTTEPDNWRFQTAKNKQGSLGFLPKDTGEILSREEKDLQNMARSVYDKRLSLGVAREQARKDLPLSTFTEAYWKIDLWNLFHFLELRMREDAQEEIREYASTIGRQLVAQWVPLSWEAFVDYRLESVHLSALEVSLLKGLLAKDENTLSDLLLSLKWLEKDNQTGKLIRNRERDEFLDKLRNNFDCSLPLIKDMQ